MIPKSHLEDSILTLSPPSKQRFLSGPIISAVCSHSEKSPALTSTCSVKFWVSCENIFVLLECLNDNKYTFANSCSQLRWWQRTDSHLKQMGEVGSSPQTGNSYWLDTKDTNLRIEYWGFQWKHVSSFMNVAICWVKVRLASRQAVWWKSNYQETMWTAL